MKTTDTKHTATPSKSNTPFFQKGEGSFFSGPEHEVAHHVDHDYGFGGNFFPAPPVVQSMTEVAPPIVQPKTEIAPPVVQPKLTVGQPNDKYEQEADKMAETAVQKKCADCEKEESVQKKSDSSDGETEATPIEHKLSDSRGAGNPLPSQTREHMESAIGSDFSDVRVHTDNSSVQMNKDLHAQAFTHGNDIYFNSGKYDTDSKDGQQLLAHELTHVVQQNGVISRKANGSGTSAGATSGSSMGATSGSSTSTTSGTGMSATNATSTSATTSTSNKTANAVSKTAGPVDKPDKKEETDAPGTNAPEASALPALQTKPQPGVPSIQLLSNPFSGIVDKVEDAVSDAVDTVGDVASDVASGVKDAASSVADTVKDVASGAVDKLKEAASWIYDHIKALVDDGVTWLKEKWNDLLNFGTQGLNSITSFFDGIIGFIKNPLGFISDAIMNFDADKLTAGFDILTSMVQGVWQNFSLLCNNLLGAVQGIWNTISGFASSIFSKIDGLMQNVLFRHLPDALQSAARKLVDFIRGIWQSIDTGFKTLFNKINTFIQTALKAVQQFIARVSAFAKDKIIATIRLFAKLVPLMRDFFQNPDKYLQPLGKRIVGYLQGVEGQMGAQISKFFGGGQKAAVAQPAPTTQAAPSIMKKDEPGAAAAPARSTATWSQIGNGVWDVMKQKWAEFKKNPFSIVTGMLMDLFLPMVGNVKDIIKLYQDIKKIVTKPLGASTLEEAWTSFLQLADIPILIFNAVASILGRTLMVPLLIASFDPEPVTRTIAAAVGYGLLGMFVQGELMNVEHKLLLLKTGANTEDDKKDAYNRIGDSIVALIAAAIFALLIYIIMIGAQIAKGVFNFVKGKFVTPKEVPIPEGKGPGEVPGEKDPNAPKGEGEEIKAETKSKDKQRTVEVDGEGGCKVCASPCEEIKTKYDLEIKKNPEKNFKQRIDAIRDDPKMTPEQKAEAYTAVEQELADIRKNSSVPPELTDLDIENETTKIDPAEAKANPAPGEPGSFKHKMDRWAEYQRRTGGKGWSYERWSNQYDVNMQQALKGNAAADAFHKQVGWGKREFTIDVEGIDRRLDIGEKFAEFSEDVPVRGRGIEYKTGKVYATQEILWEVARDGILVEKRWQIKWVFEEEPSGPLRKALQDAKIEIEVTSPK